MALLSFGGNDKLGSGARRQTPVLTTPTHHQLRSVQQRGPFYISTILSRCINSGPSKNPRIASISDDGLRMILLASLLE